MHSSNSPAAGCGNDDCENNGLQSVYKHLDSDENTHAACHAQSYLLVFQLNHAAWFSFLFRVGSCQGSGRLDRLYSRRGAHDDGDGELLGAERAARDVSRAGDFTPLPSGADRSRPDVGLQYRLELPDDHADCSDRNSGLPFCLSYDFVGQPLGCFPACDVRVRCVLVLRPNRG